MHVNINNRPIYIGSYNTKVDKQAYILKSQIMSLIDISVYTMSDVLDQMIFIYLFLTIHWTPFSINIGNVFSRKTLDYRQESI